jgi:phage shock protein PspC (stress-responsive transcriptional regulator)
MTQPPLTSETAPQPPQPPRPRRFLRSRRDRYLGGVCGGLGAYFDVDPVLFRIATVVLAVVGGFSFVAYPILWIFVPRDDGTGNPEPLPIWRLLGGRDNKPPSVGRAALIIGLVLLAIVGAVLLFVGAGWATATGGGVVMASLVVALGLLAIGGALAGRKRARWLILPALLIALPSGVVAAAGVKFDGGYGERDYRPATIGELPSGGYKLSAGRMWIDLRDVPLQPGTTTRLPIHLGIGETTVIVAESVCVQAHARSGAGVINLLGHQQQGADLDYKLTGATSRSPRLFIDSHVGLGAFEVVHNPSEARYGGPDESIGPPGFHRDNGDRFPLTNRACSVGPRG